MREQDSSTVPCVDCNLPLRYYKGARRIGHAYFIYGANHRANRPVTSFGFQTLQTSLGPARTCFRFDECLWCSLAVGAARRGLSREARVPTVSRPLALTNFSSCAVRAKLLWRDSSSDLVVLMFGSWAPSALACSGGSIPTHVKPRHRGTHARDAAIRSIAAAAAAVHGGRAWRAPCTKHRRQRMLMWAKGRAT